MALPKVLLEKLETAIGLISAGAHPVDVVDGIQDGIQDGDYTSAGIGALQCAQNFADLAADYVTWVSPAEKLALKCAGVPITVGA